MNGSSRRAHRPSNFVSATSYISSCRPVPTIFPRANFTATSSRIWRISRSLHAAKLFFRLPASDLTLW